MKNNLITLRNTLCSQATEMIGNEDRKREIYKRLFRVRRILLDRYDIGY